MTSLNQTLSEMYVSECSALQLKPNSAVITYLDAQESQHGGASFISELNFSKNFLGRKGVLPLLSVFLKCVSLRLLNLNGVGLNDFACGVVAEAVSRHPSICIVYLQRNFITADSLPALKKLTYAFLDRAEKNPSQRAVVKRRNDETEFEIHIDTNPGIFDSVVGELAVIRRTTNKMDLEAAQAAPITATAAASTSTVTLPHKPDDDEFHTDRKHSRAFLHQLRQVHRRLQQESIFNAKLSRRLKVNSDQWLTLGVYVSCSFNEFPDEAQLIHRKLIPLLNHRLKPHHVHLVPIMLHTMEDEDFRIANTHCADGAMPINDKRLPSFRRGKSQALQDAGADSNDGVVWHATSSQLSEIRELAVRDACDIFVSLQSDMFNPNCHVVDWDALDTSAEGSTIPTLLYKRKVHQVPLGLQHLFDYKAALQHDIGEKNHALDGGNGPQPKLADQLAERKILINDHTLFQRRCQERVPPCMQHTYHATFGHVDANGIARFNIAESFFETFSQDVFCAALAYRQKRLSGAAPRPTVIPLAFDCPTIAKQNWHGGHINANPFAHLEHKLGRDDQDRNKEPFFAKDISTTVLTTLDGPGVDSEAPPGTTFQAIYGQRGMGRTTQLKAVGSRILEMKHKNSNLVVTHSVSAGKKTLLGVMTGILQQLTPANTSVFADWPSFDDDDALCEAFCDSLKNRASQIPRFTACLWILIDDDDAVEFGSSFGEVFQSPKRRAMLHRALPHEGMSIRVIYTTNIRPKVHEELTVHEVPTFDEIEAADLFVYMMLGIDRVPDPTLEEVKHAAHYLVLQKKHGIKPLYLYLCARELLYANEEQTMVRIAELLPGTVEELLTSSIRGSMPQDLMSVFDAVSLAPSPLDGALIRQAVGPCRRGPAFSVVAGARSWFSKRRWGSFQMPSLSSSNLIISFLANFLHLFQNCTRSRNRGVLTQKRNNFTGSIWRQELVFLSRTVAETLALRPKERRAPVEGVLPANVWQTTLLRTSLMRDDVHTLRSLSNFFEVFKFFSTPHRVFTLLHHQRFDDLRLIVERLLLLVCGDAASGGASTSDGAKYGIDGPQRLTAQAIKSKLNELRISQQFVQNDPEALTQHTKQHPLGLLMEYLTYLMENWTILMRHPTFLYACPQYAPPVVREAIELALHKEHTSTYLRLDCAFPFAKKCFETALLLTSQAQEQINSPSAQKSGASRSTMTSVSTVVEPVNNAEGGQQKGGPRIKTYLKASTVSKLFVVSYRSIADAKPHEITPTMASPLTQLAPEDDENGGKAFGYVGVIVMPKEKDVKTSADYGFSSPSRNFAQQTLAKGTFFLSIKAHSNAISALDIVESRHAIRFASAAYYDPEIVVTALITSSGAAEASRLQIVGRLMLENIQRPMIHAIALAAVTRTQVSDNGADDGQRCPMACVAVKNMLHVFEGQRFGHDNLYNRKGSIAAQVYSGHENRVVHYGFSPAGAKLFSIDVSGHCFVWGSPESPCSGTILAVTDFGTLPSFARFVDHETLLVVTNRGILSWNSGTSQVQQLLTNPTRQSLDGNYAMLHYQPPSYVYGSLEDTELLQLPPHVKVHRLLEQLREKKHPTVTYMAFDGMTIFDAGEKQLKVFRRQHIPPQNELECDQPPILLFAKDAAHACAILPQVSTSDVTGNRDVDTWQWFLGARSAVAIDTRENSVKLFDLLKGQQVPLFFAVKADNTHRDGDATPLPLFSPLDEVAVAGDEEDRVVVAEKNGTIHVLSRTKGPLLYPTPPLTTL